MQIYTRLTKIASLWKSIVSSSTNKQRFFKPISPTPNYEHFKLEKGFNKEACLNTWNETGSDQSWTPHKRDEYYVRCRNETRRHTYVRINTTLTWQQPVTGTCCRARVTSAWYRSTLRIGTTGMRVAVALRFATSRQLRNLNAIVLALCCRFVIPRNKTAHRGTSRPRWNQHKCQEDDGSTKTPPQLIFVTTGA